MTVVPFTHATTFDAGLEPNEKVVAILEKALADAKGGILTAVAIATVRRTGHVRHDYDAGESCRGHQLVAAVAYLQHDILSASCNGAETIDAVNPDEPA